MSNYTLSPHWWDNYYIKNTDSEINSMIEKSIVKHNKKEKETNVMTNNFMNGMFGKIESGKCRLSINGEIAISTSNGYKTYNVDTGRLTNCDQFVFDIGDDFFFVMPTNKVNKGNVILVAGKPKCVIGVEENKIEVLNYENSTVETIVPERHVFMGETYFYGRIMSPIGQNLLKGKKGINKMMQIMMLKEMFGKGNTDMTSGMSSMLLFMMMGNGGFTDMFDGMFDSDDEEDVKEEPDHKSKKK